MEIRTDKAFKFLVDTWGSGRYFWLFDKHNYLLFDLTTKKRAE